MVRQDNRAHDLESHFRFGDCQGGAQKGYVLDFGKQWRDCMLPG